MSASDRRANLFADDSVPANYERHLAPAVFERWAEVLVDTAGIEPGDAVLDIACGTGVVSRRAAARAGAEGRVIALDISPAMLAQAAGHAPATGAAPIDYVEGSADALALPDASVDAVVCQQGLQFFPDRPAAAAEMRRVLAPGGVVTLSVWQRGRRLEPFDDYAEALRAVGVPPPFPRAYDHESFTLTADDVQELLSGAGFDPVRVSLAEEVVAWPDSEAAVAGIFGTPYGPLTAKLAAEQRGALLDELRRRFAPESGSGPVRRLSVAAVARALAPA